jgi:NAD(P)H-hydrate epimerase
MPRLPVLSPEQAAEWDGRAAACGIALATLMDNAGRAAAAVLAARWPDAARGGTLVVAGPGNNGGDGWVLARTLHRLGVPVWVAAFPREAGSLAASAASAALADGVREVAPDGPWPSVGLAVDALLGTGARGAPRAPIAAAIERLADLRVPVLAIDGPTGVDLGSGVVHTAAVHADCSVTFGGVRRGHLLARDEVGDIVVADIGLPDPPAEWPTLVTDRLAAGWLPPLRSAMHKGARGRIVVLGGAPGMSGAVRMAARAAFAAGAGLVHVIAPAETTAILAAAEPDVQTLALSFDGELSDPATELLDRADAVVVGPGLGRGPGRRELVRAALHRCRRVVLDADALIAFQDGVPALREALAERAAVLTPHPGEFRALFPECDGGREVDPWSAAERAARTVGATVLLKGVPSVIAAPGAPPLTVAAGNPGLATGGSGDTLAGIAATALAQGLEPARAAAVAAQALGRAADIAARRVAPRSLRPMDVLDALPHLWREWELLLRLPPVPRPPQLLFLEAPRRA